MADEIKIKAPSVEQNINVNVTGEAEIRRLYTELQSTQASLDRVNLALQNTENELAKVKAQYDNFARGNGVDILQAELERFKDTAGESTREFRTFLQSVNLNDAWGSNDYQFDELFEQLRNGSITASQAILRVKTDMRALMEENYQTTGGLFDSQMVQGFTASLDHLGETIDLVANRLNNIEQHGVKSAGMAGGSDITSVLENIKNTAHDMTEEVRESYNSITSLVSAINEYANIDETKLLAVSQTFRNIADVGRGSYGTKSMNNVASLADRLQKLNANGGTSIRFDVTGLNNLKVSKASISNLATYLPTIASVNVKKLESLSHVDLTNFNNIKVSKSAIANISSLADSIKVLKDAKAASVKVDDSSVNIDKKQDATAYKYATQAIKEYYDIQTRVLKTDNDIVLTENGWTSKGGRWSELAAALNRTKVAFDMYTNAENLSKMADEEKSKLLKLNREESTKYAIVVESLSNKEVAAAEKAAKKAEEKANREAAAAKKAADAEEKAAKKKQDSVKRLGDEFKTYENRLNGLMSDADKLKKKYGDSSAKISLSSIGIEAGDRLAPNTNNSDIVSASEAIDLIIDRINQFKSTITPDTTVEEFLEKNREITSQLNATRKEIELDAEAKKKLDEADRLTLKDINTLSKAIAATNKIYKQGLEALQKYTAAKNGKSSQQYEEIEREVASLETLNERLNSGTISQQEYIERTNQSRAAIQRATAVIKANGEAHLSAGDKIKLVASKFSQYFGIAKIVSTAWRATQQMIRATIELDDAFTQLKIVTGATDDEMQQFSETAINLAKNLGQSVADVTKSVETFSRLGYNLPDASTLAEYATILANTASVSTEEATTGLTSIIKGFNLNVSDAEHVSDVLIQVGQKYAVSAGELMEAFERSGAALNATNVSFEKAAGLVAAANASVQDASTIGTALKTVSARIRGSKTDLAELGEETDDLAEGFSKYAEELKALTGFDIMVDGSKTEFKDLYDIMQGIAQVWKKLSDTSQARVAEILGGTRQLQVISSIIGNWNDAAGAYSDAMDSAGVATAANDTYMESATAHINQFKASFEELSADVVSSDLVGTIVDAGTTILNIFDKISKSLGSLPGDFTGLAIAISSVLSAANVGELINQFQFLIILRIEYAHEVFN